MLQILIFGVMFLLMMQPVIADSQMEIFSDQNFTNQTTKFSPGQSVFVKIESDDPGEKEHIVKLKDNQYNDISTFQLVREGGGPFMYKVSFAAPNTSGFYSIEATIASAGSQNKLVKTIQVGTPANVNTKINVRTEVKGTKRNQTTVTTPTPTPTITPQAESQTPQPLTATQSAEISEISFWQKILEFLGKFFKSLFRF